MTIGKRTRSARPCVAGWFATPMIVAGALGCAGDAGREEEASEVSDSVVVQSALFVELVAPGVISTEAPEFATTLSPDAGTIYFNRASNDRSELRILVAEREGEGWGEPRIAPFSGTYRDLDPFMTPDGRRLLFSSDRPATPDDTTGDFDLWLVEREGNGWGEARRLDEPVNSDASEFFSSMSREGRLVFESDRGGESTRVFETFERNGSFGEPRPMRIGSETLGRNPAISPEGDVLAFQQQRDGSGAELFVSCRTNETWSAPRRLPRPVNSEYADFAPAFGPEGVWLYFTSERPGIVGPQPADVRPPGDLYRVRVSGLDLCQR